MHSEPSWLEMFQSFDSKPNDFSASRFLEAAEMLSGGSAPYKSSAGAAAWPLSYYGVLPEGDRHLPPARSTLFVDENCVFTHLIVAPDDTTEVSNSGLSEDRSRTDVDPCLFTDNVVIYHESSFRLSKESGAEPLSTVLARTLDLMQFESKLPPILTFRDTIY